MPHETYPIRMYRPMDADNLSEPIEELAKEIAETYDKVAACGGSLVAEHTVTF